MAAPGTRYLAQPAANLTLLFSDKPDVVEGAITMVRLGGGVP
jgi:hypothetical protein